MSHLKVYVVILNYLKWEDTRECLASLLRSGYDDYAVFVIDNNSMNQSLENLIAWYEQTGKENTIGRQPSYRLVRRDQVDRIMDMPLSRITFIQNDSNAGFAAGNNLVLKLIQHEDVYAWLLNPDMVVNENTLVELLDFSGKQPASCIVGGEVRFYEGNHELLFYGGGKVNFNFATVQAIKDKTLLSGLDYISGACLFTHASNFREYGLLPEDYFLYWEETDWCYRAKQKGARLEVCTTAVCFDKISSVIGKSFLAHYYYARNGLIFTRKFRPANIPMVLFFMTVRFFKRIITGQWGQARGMCKGSIDFFKRR